MNKKYLNRLMVSTLAFMKTLSRGLCFRVKSADRKPIRLCFASTYILLTCFPAFAIPLGGGCSATISDTAYDGCYDSSTPVNSTANLSDVGCGGVGASGTAYGLTFDSMCTGTPVYGSCTCDTGGTGGTATPDPANTGPGYWAWKITGITKPGVITVTASVSCGCPCDTSTSSYEAISKLTIIADSGSDSPSSQANTSSCNCSSASADAAIPSAFGGGSVSTSTLNENGINFNLSFGDGNSFANAGYLSLKAASPSTNLASPSGLSLPYILPTTQVISNGTIQQILAPQGLVNVDVISAYEYHLECYAASNVTSLQSNGLYGFTGSPVVTWKIANTNGSASSNQLAITESMAGSADRLFQYSYGASNSTWTLIEPDGQTMLSAWITTNATNVNITNYFRQTSFSGQVADQTQLTYQYVPGIANTLLLQGIGGTGTVTWATNYTYYSSDPTNGMSTNLLQRVDYPDGNWAYYLYDSMGRKETVFSPFGTNAIPAEGTVPNPLVNLCQETDYYYTLTNALDGIDDSGDTTGAQTPDKTVISLPALVGTNWVLQEVSRSYHIGYVENGWYVDQACPNPGALWNDPANLVTVTWKNVSLGTSDPLNGKIISISYPDGTASFYSYEVTITGLTTTVQTGQPNFWDYPQSIFDGIQTVTIQDTLGRTTSVTTSDIDSGITLAQQTYSYSSDDPTGRNYSVSDLAGRVTTYNYDCCGLDSISDPDGVVTSYGYDTLKRPITTAVWRGTNAITTTNMLDAAGRILVSRRIGTDGSVITLKQKQYDLLGRVVSQTNALNGVTTSVTSVTNCQLSVSNTYPDGGTLIDTYAPDGSLLSEMGTAARPMRYVEGIDQDGSGGFWRQFTLAIKLTSSGGTNEWIKTYIDGANREYKTVYAGATGNPYDISYYNGFGQLTNEVDPDGVSTIYAYDPKGERVYSVVDSNQNSIIDWSGADRITLTTNDVVYDNGANVRRTQTFVWSTSANTADLISTMEYSTDGLQSWNIVWNDGSPVITSNHTVYGSNGYRYQTNIASDGAFILNTYQYGRLLSSVRNDSTGSEVTGTSYAYDAHGRRYQLTDARNGTTNYTFNYGDKVTSITTPSPGIGLSAEVTSNYYDNMGRIVGSLQPDSTATSNLFYPTGDLYLSFGSRMYPIQFSYDAQGRMATMTTWQAFSNNTGSAVTSWTYDSCRGFLTGKTYPGSAPGPNYTYSAAGRLLTRIWARGTNTTYGYNGAGDLASVSYNDGSTPPVTNGYDRRGRLTSIEVGTTFTTALTYSDQGQPLTESYSGGPLDGFSVTNGYDNTLRRTNLVTLGSTVLTSNGFGYDAASRLSMVSDGTNTATYSYLADSPLVSQITFEQSGATRMITTKQYDYLNRLTSISTANASSTVLDSHNYVYNAANQRTGATNVDGTYWVYKYDALGQMISGIKYWSDGSVVAGQQFGYGFDNIGNRRTTTAGGDQWGANLRHANYSVNSLNQYSSRTVPGAVDMIGSATNTATVTVNNQPTIRKGNYYRAQLPLPNSSNPIWLSVTNLAILNQGTNDVLETNFNGNVFLPQTPEQFHYDADGNLTNDGRWIYTWDAENRLVSMTNNPNVPAGAQMGLSFVYDAKGRRISKSVNANGVVTTLDFIYDAWSLIAVVNSASLVNESFLWGLDLSGSMKGAGGVGGLLMQTRLTPQATFFSYDGRGNVSGLINSSNGALSAQYEYGPFGEVIQASGVDAKTNPFRFSTKYQDDESDMVYYGYRYYAASLGRWQNRDPIEESGGLNIYCSVNNNPITHTDSLGLDGGIDLPLPNEWANALAWLLSQIVNYQYVQHENIQDVTCPPGSSRYLLSKNETKVEEISLMDISAFGVDVPMTSYKITKPISDNINEVYACCVNCGFLGSCTTPWISTKTITTDADHVASADFGPFTAEIGMEQRTTVTSQVRHCKKGSVDPLSSWTDHN